MKLGFSSQQKQEILLFSESGVHPASCSIVTEGCFPRDEAAGDEPDRSCLSGVKIKNGGAVDSQPQHRDT
jgi:hypothetical protein